MNRIYFDCGKTAFEKLTADSALLADAAKRYSCSPADLGSRLDAEAENVSALKARLAGLSSYAKDMEVAKIESAVRDGDLKHYVYESDLFSTDDLLKLGFTVINGIPDLFLVLKHPSANTCLLLSSSDEYKCGQLVKENAPKFNGRGGGRPDNARAMFSSLSDMQAFTEAVLASL